MKQRISKLSESGSAVLVVTLVIVVLAGLGATWYAVRNASSKPASQNTQQNSTAPTPKTTNVVLVVTGRGGLCPEGPCTYPKQNLYEDGTFEGHTDLSAEDVTKVKQMIATGNLTAYKAKAATGCQSASDGQDLVLLFPQQYGERQFVPCELTAPTGNTALAGIVSLITAHQKSD